ncbi:hypothetical protein BAE44_0012985 [Dichanthelium oligosanthes]|uniref:Uncharacterized protein n=1 Tax=Dichanthelium oligosanthes TaxID=888268 RepID=A0A1E5VLI0_9POAL|nr:hypothetical protein BAE44_0012985 [Dichanthelium oligosanthes]
MNICDLLSNQVHKDGHVNRIIQDGYQVPPNDYLDRFASTQLLIGSSTSGPGPSKPNQDKQESNSDFLAFPKISSDKQKATRNKKNSKNNKKKNGKCRKQSHDSEMQTSSSPVTKVISPVSSSSSGNEKELSSSSNDFRSFSTSYYSVADSSVDSSTGSNASVNDSYTGSDAWNNTMGDDVGSLSDARSSICGDDASHDAEFQKVVSRKTAQKMKRIQRFQSPTPSPTMAASGKYKKGPSLSNVPKTGFTDEENFPALEAMEESCSSGYLPLQGELKALAPADGDAKDTDSRAASYDKISSPDHPDNSSCVDREQQKKE